MCIIIIDKKGGRLTETMVDKAIKNNQHGYGMVNLKTGEVVRTTDNKKAKQIALSSGPAVHHFRLASVGPVNEANVHPFKIDENEVLFMNGTISNINTQAGKTDTEAIAQMLSMVNAKKRDVILNYFNARFALVNTNTGNVRVAGSWIEQDELLMSNGSVLKPIMLAVYGTLRSKMGNHLNYMRNAEFVGSGWTQDLHRMPPASYVPRLYKGVDENGKGLNIRVEVYNVDPMQLLNEIDQLEGHPVVYKREKTTVILDDKRIVNPYIYFSQGEAPTGEYIADFVEYYKKTAPTNVHHYKSGAGYHMHRWIKDDDNQLELELPQTFYKSYAEYLKNS
jgi:gamma-glutamylcyclotransferase (GGCT)/AIG2-like uncharacterized protein YtfP